MGYHFPKILFVVICFSLAIWGAYAVSQNVDAKEFVESLGYGGIIVLSFFAGLNILIPVPATTLVPVFLAAELSIIGIIISLVIGTSLADLTAYALARYGRTKIDVSKIKLLDKLEKLNQRGPIIPLVILFLWASFVPFPNEIILIPLGLIGIRAWSLIPVFISGNIIHNSLITLGIDFAFPFL